MTAVVAGSLGAWFALSVPFGFLLGKFIEGKNR